MLPSRLRLVLVVFSALFCLASSVRWGERRYKLDGLVDLGELGLNEDGGMIVALGDSNGDQAQDIFTLSPDQRSVSLYLWNREQFAFIPSRNNPIVPRTTSGFLITNVVTIDVNHDGRLDLLLMGSSSPGSQWNDETKLEAWYGLDGETFAPGVGIPPSTESQPIVFDAQGDMMADLLGVPKGEKTFASWHNQASSSNNSSPFFPADSPFGPGPPCTSPDPHSHSFIDLNGDCLADLFLTCRQADGGLSYQIWINEKDRGFVFAREDMFPSGTKGVSFADIDRDGTIDMIFSACPSEDHCTINIAYNQQIGLCTAHSGSPGPCRDSQALCTADPAFQFSFDSTSGAFTTIPVVALFPHSNLVYELSSAQFIGHSPLSVQLGDYNCDGYPDLLVLIRPRTVLPNSQGQPQLLENRPCDSSSCTAAEVANHRRAFRPVTKDAEALLSIKDARSAFFMDIDEDGSLDIVVQRARSGGPASRRISFIKNNYFSDAFFLKAMVLNGACQSWCSGNGEESRYRPYGANYPGASYKFTIQDTSGTRRATAVGQLPFSSYASPTTPYSYFGLGRTNNYIENLFVGTTRHQPRHFANIEGLIPNSQVVIIPYQPEKVHDPSTWSRELFLNPGDWIPSVALTLAAATLLLAVTVGILHLNEKREDELERRRKAHTINFDAL